MELLVVMAIIAILTTFGTMAFWEVARSTNLATAGRTVQSEISLARQQSLTFHQEVEVRIFQTLENGTPVWNGIQTFVGDSGGTWKPLRKPSLLPGGIFFDPGQSGLIAEPPVTGTTRFGRHGMQNYAAFRFRPGGNTQPDLGTNNNSLTLLVGSPGQGERQSPNFLVLSISPVNGRVTTYQP